MGQNLPTPAGFCFLAVDNWATTRASESIFIIIFLYSFNICRTQCPLRPGHIVRLTLTYPQHGGTELPGVFLVALQELELDEL